MWSTYILHIFSYTGWKWAELLWSRRNEWSYLRWCSYSISMFEWKYEWWVKNTTQLTAWEFPIIWVSDGQGFTLEIFIIACTNLVQGPEFKEVKYRNWYSIKEAHEKQWFTSQQALVFITQNIITYIEKNKYSNICSMNPNHSCLSYATYIHSLFNDYILQTSPKMRCSWGLFEI